MCRAGHWVTFDTLITVGREDDPTGSAHRKDVHNADNEYSHLVSLQYI